MNKYKTVISTEALYRLETAMNTINEVSDSLYRDLFEVTKDAVLFDGLSQHENNNSKVHENCFLWIHKYYERVQSSVLAIRTISDMAAIELENID